MCEIILNFWELQRHLGCKNGLQDSVRASCSDLQLKAGMQEIVNVFLDQTNALEESNHIIDFFKTFCNAFVKYQKEALFDYHCSK